MWNRWKGFLIRSLLWYLQSGSKNTIAGIFPFAFASSNGSNESSLYCCFGGGGRWFSHIHFQITSGKCIFASIAPCKRAGKACPLLAYFLLTVLSQIPIVILTWICMMLKQNKVVKTADTEEGKSWNLVVELIFARAHSFPCNYLWCSNNCSQLLYNSRGFFRRLWKLYLK